MCSLTGDVVRGYRRLANAGRLGDPAVRIVDLKLSALIEGDYDPAPTILPLAVREALVRRDGRCCAQCGGWPATEVAPFPLGERGADPAGLWLVCSPCHRRDFGAWMAVQRAQLPRPYLRARLLERATRTSPRQPCDAQDWNHRAWASTTPPPELCARWDSWRDNIGLDPTGLVAAAAGFPAELEPWSWYAT